MAHTHHAGKDGASLAGFFQMLRARKALIFLIAALVLTTTAVVTAFMPRWYKSTTNVRVEKPEGEVKLFQAQQGGYYDPSFLQDQYKIMQEANVLMPVIRKLDLGRRIGEQLGAPAPLPDDITLEYLRERMLRIDSTRGSSVISINVYSRDAALAADIANEIARVYSEDRINFATSAQREGLAHLRKELEAQERAVSQQRDAVEKLRKDLNISGVDLNSRYSDIEIETLRQMQNSLIALSVDAIGRKTRYERFKSIPAEDRASLVNSELIQDPNIQNLLQAYLLADQNVTRLRSRLGDAHPDLIAAVDNRAKIREQLDAQLRGYENALEIAYKEAEARVAELKNQLAQAKIEQILSARERLRPFEEAAQRLDDEIRMLSSLKVNLRQKEIDLQVPKRTTEVLNRAEPARRPSKPSWPLNLAAALLFGVLLGVGASVLIEYFDTSFRSVAEVESRLQRPVLGVLPVTATPVPTGPPSEEDPAESEPYRVLHTNINLALKTSERGRSLVMLSAGPGEGKSTTLLRLSRAMGAAGERVLLIDSDLRRPTQHQLAGLKKDPGLAELLQNKADLAAVTQKNVAQNVDFIPSGSVAGFTLSLLYVDRLKALLKELRGRYDRIVFDAPPAIGVSDASVLASVVDDAVLVVQHRRNPQSMVLRAQQIIESVRRPLVGIVLNRVPPNSGEDYGYYTNNYSYYSTPRHGRTRRRENGARTEDRQERITYSERGGGSRPPV